MYYAVSHASGLHRCASPPAPYSEVRCKSSLAAATERRLCQLNLHSKESVKPIKVANLRVNQRSQINEDTSNPHWLPRITLARCMPKTDQITLPTYSSYWR